jgi:hypothetical protein
MAQDPLSTVLATPELFEAILAQFTLRELLLAQQVNHHWQHTVNTSPTLQQKLFFQAIPHKTSHQQPPQLNPLLQSLFPPFFNPGTDTSTPGVHTSADYIKSQPWFQDDFTGAPHLHEDDWFYFINNSRRAAVLRPEASWRRMFPIQPPTRISALNMSSACCTNQCFSHGGKLNSKSSHLQEKGARMGLLFDLVIECLDSWAQSSFFVQWHMFKVLGREESELKNEISIYFWNNERMCGGPIVATGLRVMKDRDEFVEAFDRTGFASDFVDWH